MYITDKINVACYLMIKGHAPVRIDAKNKNRATFSFELTSEEGAKHELAYTTSDYSRFFEAFKYLRSRALRGG